MKLNCVRCGREIDIRPGDSRVSMFCDFCEGTSHRWEQTKRSEKPVITHLSLGDADGPNTAGRMRRRSAANPALRKGWFDF